MGNPSVAVDDVRGPAELLHGLKYTPGEEDSPFIVVCEKFSAFIRESLLAVEIVLIVNEIDLHPGS